MKVVLLQNVTNLGNKFDIKDVSSGYARNLLIPAGKAEVATAGSLKKIERLKEENKKLKQVKEDLLAKNIEDISDAKVVIQEKANEKGHLFASVHKDELVNAIKDQTSLDIEEDFIVLEEPLKEVGEHEVVIKAGDKEAKLKVTIEALSS